MPSLYIKLVSTRVSRGAVKEPVLNPSALLEIQAEKYLLSCTSH